VAAGDVLLLFTDGLFEVENSRGEWFSESGLREAISRSVDLPTEGLIQAAVAAAERFAAGRPFPDDMCVVGVEITRLERSGKQASPASTQGGTDWTEEPTGGGGGR
jgi:sigma-B regulation protein RsbU (phosphoserine phosphatase)